LDRGIPLRLLPGHDVPRKEESEIPMTHPMSAHQSNVGETMIEAITKHLKAGAVLKIQMSPMREPVLVKGITFVGNEEIILIPDDEER
jgi:hypothetical protein